MESILQNLAETPRKAPKIENSPLSHIIEHQTIGAIEDRGRAYCPETRGLQHVFRGCGRRSTRSCVRFHDIHLADPRKNPTQSTKIKDSPLPHTTEHQTIGTIEDRGRASCAETSLALDAVACEISWNPSCRPTQKPRAKHPN